MIQVKRAVKYGAKGRIALIGPSGSGKSYSGLTAARVFAGPEGKILAIDTEHGSLSKYADLFDFDVVELDSYSVDTFLECLTHAEENNYAVFMVDSISHFWMGKDGALEYVDSAAKRHRDSMGGWKDYRPQERLMIERMIASPCHIIVTMRTKTEYVEEVNAQGKKVRRKIGLGPVQRDGLEYEFDGVFYMDDENTLIVEKTRCPLYSKRTFSSPTAKAFEPFAEWLRGKPAPVKAPAIVAEPPAPEPASVPWTMRPDASPVKAERTAVMREKRQSEEHYVDVEASVPPEEISRVERQKADAYQRSFEAEKANGGPRTTAAVAAEKIAASNTMSRWAPIQGRLTAKFGYPEMQRICQEEFKKFGVKNSAQLTPAQEDELESRLLSYLEGPKSVPAKAAPQGNAFTPPPDAVIVLWDRMGNIPANCEVFKELKTTLIGLVGEATGTAIYRAALAQHGGKDHANEYKTAKDMEKARGAVRSLYESIQNATTPQTV